MIFYKGQGWGTEGGGERMSFSFLERGTEGKNWQSMVWAVWPS